MSSLPPEGVGRERAVTDPWKRVRLVLACVGVLACVAGLIQIAGQRIEIEKLRGHAFVGEKLTAAETKAAWEERQKKAEFALAQVAAERAKVAAKPVTRGKTYAERAAEPEFRALDLKTRLADLDRRYGLLFARLNLSGDRATALRELLMKRDVDPPGVATTLNEDEKAALRREARERCEQDIVESLTPAEQNQYAAFKRDQPSANLIFELQNLLASRAETLDTGQTNQLMQLFQTSSDGPPLLIEEANWPATDRGTYLVSEAVLDIARSFLSPNQLAALSDLRELQLSQIALNERIAQIYEKK
jgi:hypothetical protein